MKNENDTLIYSGADPRQVKTDLLPLVDFQDEGIALNEIERLIRERLIPHLMKYDRPGFQSMFNVPTEAGAELGARIALTYNQGVTNWQVSPGGAMLEELCCRALCRLFHFPPDADATFMYSGTYANQEAVYLALHKKAEMCGFDLGEKGLHGFPNPSRLALLVSEDAHFSFRHAVRMLGLGEQSLVTLKVDKNRRIDMLSLEKDLKTWQRERDIFCIAANAGTTSTGAVDPILPLVDICKRSGAWLHVDGAYGLVYSLVPGWQELFSGYELADSVAWDPHKQLGIPIPNSLLFVKRKEDFKRMALYSHYFNRPEDDELPNPGLKSPPSTRPMAALPLVVSLRSRGLKNVIGRLRASLTAIRGLAEHLAQYSDIELSHTPDTAVLCFRVKPEGLTEPGIEELQKYIHRKINTAGKYSISVTKLGDKTVLRMLAISPQVTQQALLETAAEIRSLGASR